MKKDKNGHQLHDIATNCWFWFQSETWIKEGNTLLNDVHRHMNQCRSSTDAERLVSTLDKFIENGRPMQESRLQRMSELVIELYGKSRGYQNLS